MNPKRIVFCIFTVSFLFSCIYLPISATRRHEEHLPSKEQNNTITQEETFTVKSHNGKISVFSSYKSEPIYTLDSPYIRDLPEHDQILLQNGIIAKSKEELMKILEDYDY